MSGAVQSESSAICVRERLPLKKISYLYSNYIFSYTDSIMTLIWQQQKVYETVGTCVYLASPAKEIPFLIPNSCRIELYTIVTHFNILEIYSSSAHTTNNQKNSYLKNLPFFFFG